MGELKKRFLMFSMLRSEVQARLNELDEAGYFPMHITVLPASKDEDEGQEVYTIIFQAVEAVVMSAGNA